MLGSTRLERQFLQEEDLVRFNYWLWITRLRSIAGLLLIALVFGWAATAPALRLAPIVGLCLADVTASVAYFWWLRARRALRTLAYVQLIVDTCAIVTGLFFVEQSRVLFHFMLLLVVVPATMIEWQCGLVIATLATAGHFLLLSVQGGTPWMSIGGLLPPASFFLIASQSLFYAQHLTQKNVELASAAQSLNDSNRRLEEEAAISAALLRTAQALTSSLDPYEILQRLNEVVREALGCDFSVTLLLDERRDVYRVAAISGSEVDVVEEVRNFEFPRALPVFTAAAQRGLLAVENRDSPLFPRPLMERWHITSFLCADLQRAGTSVGILGAGFNDRVGPFSQRESRLVSSSAQQAAVALDNARLVESLRGASRLKSDFIGTMSHELRSPLNVVIGYVDLLLDGHMGHLTPEQQETLERVSQHAFQLLELIEETLDVNRLEAGQLPLDVENFLARDFLTDLKESIPAAWRKRDVEVTWNTDAAPIMLHSDRLKLKKVLRNLIHNALKFTDHGTVAIKVAAHDGWVDFTVHDTGIGISPEALPVIFEMFRQADGSSTRRHGGVGLGLYIVKQLVRGLGGEVTVTSTAGAGSTFHVRLRSGE